ncbi:hypothetical protein CTI12_AA259870 [Artemisia annua]|uniref:Helitron helicase-like domain-containing protein n=1 Tax=Artemisia annua TaxID=35608 RepID=A0A2U1NIZ1_ARTAN|nr:hypothetical protein CTI12_AA259870 [Artemisia annua]
MENKRMQRQVSTRNTNDYEMSRRSRIQENQQRLQALGVKNLAKSLTSLVESDKTKKKKKKPTDTSEKDADYMSGSDFHLNAEEDNPEEAATQTNKKHKKYIAPMSMTRYKNLAQKRMSAPNVSRGLTSSESQSQKGQQIDTGRAIHSRVQESDQVQTRYDQPNSVKRGRLTATKRNLIAIDNDDDHGERDLRSDGFLPNTMPLQCGAGAVASDTIQRIPGQCTLEDNQSSHTSASHADASYHLQPTPSVISAEDYAFPLCSEINANADLLWFLPNTMPLHCGAGVVASDAIQRIPGQRTLEDNQSSHTSASHADPSYHLQPTPSVISAEDYAFPLCSEINANTDLLRTEDSSMIHENDTPTIPEHLTHDGSSLPSRTNLSTIASSSNDSVHNLHPLRNGDSLPDRRHACQGTVDSSMIHENGTPTIPEQLTQNSSSLPSMINLPATASSSNDGVHNLHALRNGGSLPNRRRTRQVTMHSSSTRRQRQTNLQKRVPRSAQGPPSTYKQMGACDQICHHCNARFWYDERVLRVGRQRLEYHKCCNGGKSIGHGLRADIVEHLIELLDDHNELVQLFRTARNKMAEIDVPQFKGGPDVETDFDVVIEQHDRTFKRVNKLNASYMSLQFPLIFFFGEDGYHLGRLLLSRGITDDPPKKMSMKMQMEPNSSIGASPDSTGKQIVTESQDTTLAKLKEQDTGKAIVAQPQDITLVTINESDAGKPLHVRVY